MVMPRLKELYDATNGSVVKAQGELHRLWRRRTFILPEVQHDWTLLRREVQKKLAKCRRGSEEMDVLLGKWEKAYLREQFYDRVAELIKLIRWDGKNYLG